MRPRPDWCGPRCHRCQKRPIVPSLFNNLEYRALSEPLVPHGIEGVARLSISLRDHAIGQPETYLRLNTGATTGLQTTYAHRVPLTSSECNWPGPLVAGLRSKLRTVQPERCNVWSIWGNSKLMEVALVGQFLIVVDTGAGAMPLVLCFRAGMSCIHVR